MFGATIMDASQFGWVLGFKNVSGVIMPVIGDNATGLTNQLQVCSSERCLGDACLLGLLLHVHAATFVGTMDVVTPAQSLASGAALAQPATKVVISA
jgi:hypothetical protein